jgi:hypothetical protein
MCQITLHRVMSCMRIHVTSCKEKKMAQESLIYPTWLSNQISNRPKNEPVCFLRWSPRPKPKYYLHYQPWTSHLGWAGLSWAELCWPLASGTQWRQNIQTNLLYCKNLNLFLDSSFLVYLETFSPRGKKYTTTLQTTFMPQVTAHSVIFGSKVWRIKAESPPKA